MVASEGARYTTQENLGGYLAVVKENVEGQEGHAVGVEARSRDNGGRQAGVWR